LMHDTKNARDLMTSYKPKRCRRRKRGCHKGVYVSTKTGASCSYRSGWELGFMMYLDDSPDVISYEYESLKIPYVANVRFGRTRNYIPDFVVSYVNGMKYIIEIKPSRRVAQATVQKKLAAAQSWAQAHGFVLAVLTEIELKDMGVKITGFTRDNP